MTKQIIDRKSRKNLLIAVSCGFAITSCVVFVCFPELEKFGDKECLVKPTKVKLVLPKEPLENRISPPSSAPPGGNVGDEYVGKLPNIDATGANHYNMPSVEKVELF